jgi:putative ABC transport system ATP-binding protein
MGAIPHVTAPVDIGATAAAVGLAPASLAAPVVARLRDVTKTYRMGDQQVHALRGVNLDLYAGELLVLLGPSGSGKSTLLNILGALDSPTTGTAFYLDHDLT